MITSSSAAVAPDACWRIAFPPMVVIRSLWWKRVARDAIRHFTFPSVMSGTGGIRVATGCITPSRKARAATAPFSGRVARCWAARLPLTACSTFAVRRVIMTNGVTWVIPAGVLMMFCLIFSPLKIRRAARMSGMAQRDRSLFPIPRRRIRSRTLLSPPRAKPDIPCATISTARLRKASAIFR